MTQKEFYDLIDQFDETVRSHSWKGGRHPDDIPGIERMYNETKGALQAAYIKIKGD